MLSCVVLLKVLRCSWKGDASNTMFLRDNKYVDDNVDGLRVDGSTWPNLLSATTMVTTDGRER